jgi:hypothetical protein
MRLRSAQYRAQHTMLNTPLTARMVGIIAKADQDLVPRYGAGGLLGGMFPALFTTPSDTNAAQPGRAGMAGL